MIFKSHDVDGRRDGVETLPSDDIRVTFDI